MAVYTQRYQVYDGPRTPQRWRWLVLPRHAFRQVARSRLFLLLVAYAALWPLGMGAIIYLRHNTAALGILDMNLGDLLAVDASFFVMLLRQQTFAGLLLALKLGPGLITTDIQHNGLPLYLSRPLGRWQYVLGKFSVLAIVLSAVTWVPAVVLFLLQTSLEGLPWAAANARVLPAVLAASWLWLTMLSLLILAASALVRRAPVAGGAVLGIMFVASGLARTVKAITESEAAILASPFDLVNTAWLQLFGTAGGRGFLGSPLSRDLSPFVVWPVLAAYLALCLVILRRRLQAYEVVH